MTEQWKPIAGYEGRYEVSDQGHVRTFLYTKPGAILKRLEYKGYVHVDLCINDTVKRFRVHRLVGAAFVPNPDNKPFINHKDGNRSNNHATNLEWSTPSENQLHRFKVLKQVSWNKGLSNPHKLNATKAKEIRQKLALGATQRQLAEQYGVAGPTISCIKRGVIWKEAV